MDDYKGERAKPKPVKKEAFEKIKNCDFCGESLTIRNFLDVVRDHCHVTGKSRGVAHQYCNMAHFKLHQEKIEIPVFFHNLKNYDAHLIMQETGKTNCEIACIANNMEKYITFSLGKLHFRDSCQLMLKGLNVLVECNKTEKRDGSSATKLQILQHYEADTKISSSSF